jgi:hypothetical protein
LGFELVAGFSSSFLTGFAGDFSSGLVAGLFSGSAATASNGFASEAAVCPLDELAAAVPGSCVIDASAF